MEEVTAALTGVEITEESRYIDHTNATPFEESCAEIQDFLKKTIASIATTTATTTSLLPPDEKSTIYQCAGQSMATVLKFIDAGAKDRSTSTMTEAATSIDEGEDIIRHLFKVAQYVALIAAEDDMRSFTPSMKSYVYSSLITAAASVSSASHSAAAAAAAAGSDKSTQDLSVFFFGKCEREIYGYQRLSLSYCVDAVRHYISYIMEDIDHESPLYYFDGLLSAFHKDLASFLSHNEVTKTVFVELTECFVISYVPLEVSGQNFHDHPVLQNTIEDLWFSNYDFSPYTDVQFALIVKAQWEDVKHSNIIENSKFSTFQPSKLTPSCWGVELSYDQNRRALPLSRCLRKLFTLYLLGKGSPEKNSVSDLHQRFSDLNYDSGSGANFTPSFQKTKYTAAVLSRGTRDVLDYLLGNASVLTEKSDFEEYLMKLNARFLWVQRQELENIGLLPWNWLKDVGAAPVGSWLSLAAIYVGSKDSLYEMLDIWQGFVRDLRIHQESGVPLARLYAPTPIGGGESVDDKIDLATTSTSTEVEDSHNLFWDDIMAQKRSHGTPFSLPDCSKTAMYQKLQMLQMCILCKDENVYTSIDMKNEDKVFLENGGIVVPNILRRMPPTQDSQLQQQFMTESVINNEDKESNDMNADVPLLKWQVSHPAIVADCRSFKALNPNATSEDFLRFYEATSLKNAARGTITKINGDALNDDGVITCIFNACDAMQTEDQKPLFKANMEGEKVLNYMESISVVAMASELLQSSMVAIHFLLKHTHADLKSFSCFNQRIDALETCIMSAVTSLKSDVASFEDVDASSICQTTLHAIDKVCEQTEMLEDMIHKLKFLSTATNLSFRMIESLCATRDEVRAETIEEARVLFDLAKNSPCAELGVSEWRSFDGRALGKPTSKSYVLSVYNDDTHRKDLAHMMRADMWEKSLRVSSFKTEYAYY